MTDAARWFAQRTADRRPSVEVSDVDCDGEVEIILGGERLYAVLSPVRGGRLTHLFALAPHGGALVVGNHADDWNWQEELNQYMDQPPNHPGALADSGFEHDHYEVSALGATAGCACVKLTNVEKSSELFGARKSLLLVPKFPALVVRYEIPYGLGGFSTEACLSPDYLHLLRQGRRDLSPCGGENWRGCRNGDVAVWVGMDPGEGTVWTKPEVEEAGHSINVRVEAHAGIFHLLLGCGPTDEEGCRWLIERGRDVFDWVAAGKPSETLR
jgi:hypothetical protein